LENDRVIDAPSDGGFATLPFIWITGKINALDLSWISLGCLFIMLKLSIHFKSPGNLRAKEG
jgi:hypothetical protein